MLKKILVLCLISTIIISSLAGCGKNKIEADTQKENMEFASDNDSTQENNDKFTFGNKENVDKDTSNESFCNFRTEPNTPEEVAYVAYEEYLKSHDYTSCGHYNFEYIDDDEFPELIIESYSLGLSYKNGEVIELGNMLGTFFAYTKGEGYFFHMGAEFGTSIYERITDNGTETVAYDIKDYKDENMIEYDYIFYVDGKEVSEDEYNNCISSMGEFEYLSDASNSRENMYEAYKAFIGLPDEVTFSEDEAWKEAYYNSYEFYDDVTTEYYIVDPNNDGIPEVIMEDVDGAKKIFYLDKFNTLRDLGWGYPIYEGASGCIYIGTEISPQQIMNNAVFTEYDYSEETGTWVANNQLEIALDDDWEERLPGGYDNSEGQLFKDSDYCSYKVNGKDYSSYEEAANAFSKEYAGGAVQEINTYNGNYKSYNYNQFKQAILDYGLETYEPLMYQVTKFEFKDGRLDVVADNAPKLENDSLQSFEISYPIATDCKWYSKFEGNIEGITTYDYICKCQQERRNDYDTLDKIGLTMGEASFFLGIKVKDGVIVEIYLDYAL
ncbi:MAG: hypothetical protein J6P57_08635 [Lachnospiraceae bacterium]|nr:hypothetical protein [Lachnospiraceae bacterium]